MYPFDYFQTFPPFPRLDGVFVAVSFGDLFVARIEKVIKPGIFAAGIPPIIVSDETKSGAITTEIVDYIGRSKLIFADISEAALGVRNANVMYEVGLAHAVRPPQDVVLFRSDTGQIPFDISGIRVINYQPDREPEKAKQLVTHYVGAALKEQKNATYMAIQKSINQLDQDSFGLLMKCSTTGVLNIPAQKTMGDEVLHLKDAIALSRLLDLGLIKAGITKATKEIIMNAPQTQIVGNYTLTPLGIAVYSQILVDSEILTAVNGMGISVNKSNLSA